MSIFTSHLNSAASILKIYNGDEPFHLFIKKYFASNKKYGSKDRKQIASLCYNYYRLGHAANNISAEERIVLGTSVCEGVRQLQSPDILIKNIFPFRDELSGGINADKFNLSFLIQPKMYLRIRPGNEKRVTGKLSGAGIEYEKIAENCIALANASKLNSIIELDKEAVVQDYNSQRVGEFMLVPGRQPFAQVWDCCAASGGKSILAFDRIPNIKLTVSDKRESILQNLKKRFATVGIKKYLSFVADLATGNGLPATNKFDLIICDVPCTGSGTWSRTPEQLFYFKKEMIEKYAVLQKKICENVIPHLKPGGNLLYITCSVFKKENEDAVKYIQKKFNLQLQKKELLKGYEIKADTMFAALLTAPLS